MISVLLADDSALMRREIKNILESDPSIQVVAAARNGLDAVELTKRHKPDVVTMDINMPVMDGITALQTIMMESPCPVIMLSSLTQKSALTTFECLELGAVDFIPKMSGTISRDIASQAAEIIAKVKQAATPSKRVSHTSRFVSSSHIKADRSAIQKAAKTTSKAKPPAHSYAKRIVAIGISTGGPKTLLEVIPFLPANLDAAIVIVQHMPEAFTGPFAQRLDQCSAIPVKEAAAGDLLLSGRAYVARGGKHLMIAKANGIRGPVVRMVSRPDDVPHIPSVDVMMQSALEAFGGENTIGVLMTGMGADGADAMVSIRKAGGQTIAEHESTCVVYGMPAQAVVRGGAEFILPHYEISNKITELIASMR